MTRVFGAICAAAALIAIGTFLWAYFHEDQLQIQILSSPGPIPVIKVVNQRTLDPVAGARVHILPQPGGFGSNMATPLGGWWDTDSSGLVRPAPPIAAYVGKAGWTPIIGQGGEEIYQFFIDAHKPRFKPARYPASYIVATPLSTPQWPIQPVFRPAEALEAPLLPPTVHDR